MPYKKYGATGEPDTCKWCGAKLRRPVLTTVAVERNSGPLGGVTLRRIPKAERVRLHDKPGDYGDGHFCTMRCGYDFGVAMADLGKGFQPVGGGK